MFFFIGNVLLRAALRDDRNKISVRIVRAWNRDSHLGHQIALPAIAKTELQNATKDSEIINRINSQQGFIL